jgi:hypothetical protein
MTFTNGAISQKINLIHRKSKIEDENNTGTFSSISIGLGNPLMTHPLLTNDDGGLPYHVISTHVVVLECGAPRTTDGYHIMASVLTVVRFLRKPSWQNVTFSKIKLIHEPIFCSESCLAVDRRR